MKDTATLKVLMIEDSPTDALLIQKNLKTALEPGFEVTWVKRLDEALSLARGQAFDVCLLDLSLPDSTGIETCLRMREAAPKLPIVVLTGEEDEKAGLEALRGGVQDYLSKSVDAQTVVRAIRYAVERKAAEEELRLVNESLRQSRIAALNLAEDAVTASKRAEQANAACSLENSERKKREEQLHGLNRTLRALSRSSQAMMRAGEETAYLKEICSIITEDCGYSMVWIGFAQDDEAKSIRPVASAGFEQGYLDTLNLTWADVPNGKGPTGSAIRTGRMSMCTNMLTDPAFAPWREEALKRGYASSIVFPLMQEGKAFGAITIYAKTPKAFQEEEIKLLSELAEDLTYGIITMRVRIAAKQTQDALHEERRLIDTVLQTTGGLIIGLDRQGRIIMFNHACEKATGYAFDEVRGKTLWEFLLAPEEADSVQSVFNGIIAGAIPAEMENENYWVTKDGTRRYIRWANSAIKNGDGAIEMFIGTGIDITEHRTMEEMLRVKGLELLTANRELDAFSYSISHDLRAPLHVITGFSQLLLENYGERLDDRGKEYLNLLFSEVDRMGRLIGDILNLSRITRQEIRRVKVDMSALSSEIAARLRREQPDRPVEFVIEQNHVAQADEGLMRIVLENLLGNAWKFTKKRENARIEFGLADDDGRRGFFVRDNGAGFNMDGAQRLFTPFQRLHTRSEFEGTGIGLALVKRVITRHGGEVWARSRKGEGAQFYFTVG